MAARNRGAGARRRRSVRRAQMRSAKSAPVTSTFTPLTAADLSPEELVALEGFKEFAPMPSCANCDHAFASHSGDEGPCSMDSCDCMGYAPAKEEAAAEAAPVAVSSFRLMYVPADSVPPGALDYGQAVALAQGLEPSTASTTITKLEVQGGFLAEVVPAPAPSPSPAPPVESGAEWSAILCPEGQLTSDGRAFAPGSISWRELPLTLMAMTETSEGGHIGAEVAGRIDEIWRDDAAGLIRARGVFADTDYGALIASLAIGAPGAFEAALAASLVTDEVLRGVSVDLAIENYEVGPRSDWFDEAGNWAPKAPEDRSEPSPAELLLGTDEPTIAVVTKAEIGMTTVCPFPAFAVAKIAVGSSLVAGGNPAFWTVTSQAGWTVFSTLEIPEETPAAAAAAPALPDCGCTGDVLTASAAGIAPVAPPAHWFDDPALEEATALTVDDDGRVFGHAALWNVCHIGLPGCRTAPHTTTDYSYFHLGEIELEDGSRVTCGQITIDAPHAGLTLDGASATAHYDHTGCVVAHVRVGEDEHGIWVAGALEPTASADKVRLLRGAKLSGDWRKFPDTAGQELVALLAVNVPGFPVPRAEASLVASVYGPLEVTATEVLALIAAGIPDEKGELTAEEQAAFDALRLGPEFARLAS